MKGVSKWSVQNRFKTGRDVSSHMQFSCLVDTIKIT